MLRINNPKIQLPSILISIGGFLLSITCWAAIPTFKANCGNPGNDSACSDAGCRLDFANAVITNCEVDLVNAQVNGWSTYCTVSSPDQVALVQNSNGNSFNLYPNAPTNSLGNLHPYFKCDAEREQGRQ